jgi:hypothetical protein
MFDRESFIYGLVTCKGDRLEKKHDAAMSATRRRLLMRPLHLLLRPLGYLELTDVYKIELTRLPALFEIPPYRIVEAQARGVEEIAADPSFDDPPAVVRTLWKEGHHCFVAKYGERIVAYNWIAFAPVQEEEYSCEPGPADAICLNAYTAAAHRGKGLHYLLDVATERIQVTEASLATLRPQLQAGKIKMLASTNSMRPPGNPEVPTVKEAG